MNNNLRQIYTYLFEPRFRFNRIQFNLIAIFLIFIGSVFGIYITATKVFPDIFALNDTKKEWTYSVATATDYTYDSNLMTVDNTEYTPVLDRVKSSSLTVLPVFTVTPYSREALAPVRVPDSFHQPAPLVEVAFE